MTTTTFRRSAAASIAVAALFLGACSSDGESGDAQSTTADGTATAASTTASAGNGADNAASAEDGVILTDGWVRANSEEMTGVFGTIHNPTDSDLQLVSVDVDVDARAELHETVEEAGSSVMQEAKGGLTVPANGVLELKPGSYHIMLMDLDDAIEVGQTVTMTLHFSDGTAVKATANGRAFEGANEQYRATDHGSMGSGGDAMNGAADDADDNGHDMDDMGAADHSGH